MNIICDQENPIMMIPLFVQWGVKRCNIKDCSEKPFSIITDASKEAPIFGMCKKHLEEARATKGNYHLSLEFD